MHSLNEILKAFDDLPKVDQARVLEHVVRSVGDTTDEIVTLLRKGGMTVSAPDPAKAKQSDRRLAPLKLEGELVSEELIRERR